MSGSNSITNIIVAISASLNAIQTEHEKLSKLQEHLLTMVDQLECAEADLEDAIQSLERAGEQLDMDAPPMFQRQEPQNKPGNLLEQLMEDVTNRPIYYLIWESETDVERRQAILADSLNSAIAASEALLQDPDMGLAGYRLLRIDWFDKDDNPCDYEPQNKPPYDII